MSLGSRARADLEVASHIESFGSKAMEQVVAAVVGGGFAGSQASLALKQEGIRHLVLEKNDKPLHAWRAERWDSFRMNTPHCGVEGRPLQSANSKALNQFWKGVPNLLFLQDLQSLKSTGFLCRTRAQHCRHALLLCAGRVVRVVCPMGRSEKREKVHLSPLLTITCLRSLSISLSSPGIRFCYRSPKKSAKKS